MAEEQSEFDFASWLVERPSGSFRDCVRAAVDQLALEDSGLRSRLVGALFCLSCCREGQVPERFRSDVNAIHKEIKLPAGDEIDDGLDVRLQKWARKCKLRTAVRIARKIIALERALMS